MKNKFFYFYLISILFVNKRINCQNQNSCQYEDLLYNVNKYNPVFDLNAYTTTPITVDQKNIQLLEFSVYDKDTQSFNVKQFKTTTNDSLFEVVPDETRNLFLLRLLDTRLNYNINLAHRHVLQLTSCDSGVPIRCSNALVIIPLINANINPPTYSGPVVINAAITLKPGSFLGQLNAYDIDGDNVSYSMSANNDPNVIKAIDVRTDGRLFLNPSQDLTIFPVGAFHIIINLRDCCVSKTSLSSVMNVTMKIIEVNMFSPTFIQNERDNINYCENTFKANENSFFQIEIRAKDDDKRGMNGEFDIKAPNVEGRTPQNSFTLDSSFSMNNRTRRALVKNIETFDYENPKYGSNTMYVMFYAEDHGRTPRSGYCYLSIEIQDVNDNIPVFSQSSYTIYIYDGYKIRTWSYRFVATDADSGDNGRVEIFMNTAMSSQLALDIFNLTTDGVLSIKDTKIFDDSNATQFTFTIFARDNSPTRNSSNNVAVTIIKSKLNMLPPFFLDFPDPPVLNDVSEMTPRYTVLKNFTLFMQADTTNQFLRCYLSPKPSPEWFSFRYPSASQQLSKNENCVLRVEDQMNYEYAQQMVLYVVAEIGDRLQQQTARELKILVVKLKDENVNAPKFFSSFIEGSVVEGDDDINKTVVIVRAYDLDKTPPYNTISYDFYGLSNADGYFSINKQTGEIKLVKGIRHIKNINLEVVAYDGAPAYGDKKPHETTIYVNMKIININSNPPQFISSSYSFNVNENASPGQVIGVIDVADEDLESFFNFSISDSTFGLRPVFYDSKSIANALYRGSAELYLNTYLDSTKIKSYKVTAYVSDGQFISNASVVINVNFANVRPPTFTGLPYSVSLTEKTLPTSNGELLTFQSNASSPTPNIVYRVYSTPYLDKSSFAISNNGLLRLTNSNGINRDAPNGLPVLKLPISVTDTSGDESILTSYSTVTFNIADENDNPPKPVYTSSYNPLIIMEGAIGNYLDINLVDVDDPALKHGPPFVFNFLNYTNLFDLQLVSPCPQVSTPNACTYRISSKIALDRNTQKSYNIGYSATDSGGYGTTGVIQIIVGNVLKFQQSAGSKEVDVVTIDGKLPTNTFMSYLYVTDNDDWSRAGKNARCSSTYFNALNTPGLQIYSSSSSNQFPSSKDSTLNLTCQVTGNGYSTVNAQVQFESTDIEFGELFDVPFLRIFGVTVDDFMQKTTILAQNGLDSLTSLLKKSLNLATNDKLLIITVRGYNRILPKDIDNAIPLFDRKNFGVEVYFIAIQNNLQVSSLKTYIMIKNDLNSYSQFDLDQFGDQCPTDYCPSNSVCKSTYTILSQQRLVADGNATAFVGLNSLVDPECFCNLDLEPKTCLNSGTIVPSGSDFYCNCPSGYTGPRCELLTLTFKPTSNSHTYALFNPFVLCAPTRIELEFTTTGQRGLLFFNGAIDREARYFISAQFVNNTTIIVNVGSTNILQINNLVINDKYWHKLDITIDENVLQVNFDKCQSSRLILQNMSDLIADSSIKSDNRLSIGGVPPEISKLNYYYPSLLVFEYEGCIRNVKINGQIRDLSLIKNNYNQAEGNCDCRYQFKQPTGCINSNKVVQPTPDFPWWIILIVIVALILLVAIFSVVIVVVRKRNQKPKASLKTDFPSSNFDPLSNENLLNYNTQGGGEADQDNYNIDGMKIPITGGRQSNVQPSIPTSGITADAPTNDQYLIFDDEGAGSQAGSLSSIEDDFNIATGGGFDNLQQYGQKFSNLNSLYNPPEIDNNNDIQFRIRGNEYQNSFSNSPQIQFRN